MKKILLLAATVLMTGTALKAQVTVTGGATASYTSLGAAFAAINVGTHTGAITVDISASITETASAILNSSGEGGSSYTSVLIFPSVDGVVINGPSTAASGRGVIELNGADNVTVDGDNPNTPGINKNLTIVNNNPNTTTYASVIRVATHTVTPQYNNADNIAIKNLILNGNATGRNVSGTTSTTGSENTTFGVVVGPNGGSSVSALTSVTGVMNTTTTANAFSVDNCSINSVARGIVFNGNTSASSSGVAFTNNVIGSAGTLTGNPPYNSPATTVYSKAIFIQGVSSAVITGNIIQNILSYVGTTFSGIELNTAIGAGNVTISSNTITGVVNNGSGAVNAVSLLASTGAYMITSNIINNIQSSTSSVMGVNISSGATAGLIENNKISYVYARSTSGFAARGILLGGGNAITVRNNFIWDLNAVSNNNTTGTTFGVRGISITSGTNHFIHHNTISLSGPMLSGGSSPDITTCLSIAGTGQTGIDVRNNLFSNTMSGGNSGAIHTIIQLPTGGTSAMNLSINNNAYFGSSTVNVGLTTNPTAYSISNFNSGATTPATNWRAYTSTLGNTNNDNASFALTTAAPFISASNLHINNALPVFLESAGATIGVTSDIDGDVRPGPVGSVNGGGTAPDIGADEFDGIPLVANDIAATAFVSPTNGGGVGQSMNFSPQASFSNLGSSGQTNFNVIYRIINSSNAVVYTQTNVVASLNSLATTTVTFPVTSLATAGTYTIRAIASLAGDMATVNDSISGTMSILAPLCGTYNIGAAQAFPFNTLTNAITRLNQVGVSCGVTFLLDDASYSTSETFPLVINPVLGGSSTNTVLIRPNVGVTSTVTGSGSSIFKLFNTYYVTIDGMNAGGSSLTLNNTNSGASAVVWLASTASTGPGNNNIGINNITAIGGGTTSSSSFGIVAGVDGATPSTAAGFDNDNITIQGNAILKSYYGIYANGTASVAAGALDNLSITSNTIGPVTAGASNLAGTGIYVQNAPGVTVNNNLVRNIFTSSADISGIYLSSGINVATVSQNTVNNIVSSASSSSLSAISGIHSGTNVINVTISKNTVTSVYNTNSGGYGARGINMGSGIAASNNSIQNNMVSDVYAYGDVGPRYWPIGIALEGPMGGVNVEFNTVNLYGPHTGYASTSTSLSSSAFYQNSSGGNIVLRNNIFSNSYDFSNKTNDVPYAITSTITTTYFSTINYNDYYVTASGTSNPALGYAAGAVQLTLPAIQTSFGQNVNSMTVAPVYVAANDLHLVPASNVALDNFGTPVAGITTDIDNQTRNVTTPDMGADEFTSPVCTAADGGTITTTSYAACAGQTLAITSGGVSTGINTVYQWKISTTPGGPYSNVSGGAGATTDSYTTGVLPFGIYYFVLETQCTSSSLTDISNEATVTINQVPTASITSNAPICSGTNLNLMGGSDIGTNFSWTGPAGFVSASQNPVITNAPNNAGGTYNLIVSTANCTAAVVSASIAVNITPGALTITPSSAAICSGDSQTLTVTGGVVPNATLNFGTGINQNSSTSYPAPFTAYYGGQRMQMLILASEMTAAGFSANSSINSIEFPVVSLGANWGTSITSNQNFQVNIGTTALTTLTSFQTGLINVVAPQNFTPTVGFNMLTFSSPFIWDGVSNVILETTFSNNFSGVGADAVFSYTTGTGFSATIVHRADSQTAATIAAATTVDVTTSSRPDFKLNSTGFGSYTWSPPTGLSTTTGATVIATPSSSQTYTVDVMNGTCSSSTNVAVNVTATPTVNIASTNTSVCAGNSATFTASGATTYSWNSGATTNTIVDSPATSTTYTVTGFNGACTGIATASITVNTLPSVTLTASNPTVCASGPSVALTGSPVGGAYSGSNVSGPMFTPPSTAGTFVATYSYTDGVTGCANTATTSIDVSICIGIENIGKELNGLQVYPNPNAGEFVVELGNGLEKTVEVCDVTGRVILSSVSDNDKVEMNISSLANGVYFVKIQSNNKVEIIKIVKQ